MLYLIQKLSWVLINYNGKGGKNTDIRMGFLKNFVVLRDEKESKGRQPKILEESRGNKYNYKMKKLLLVIIVLSACNVKPGVDGREFIGNWIGYQNGGSLEDGKKFTMEITKRDIFFWVIIKLEGKDMYDVTSEVPPKGEKALVEDMNNVLHQYQLSPDKQFLIPISGTLGDIIHYDDTNHTLQNGCGWFKKK